MTIFVATVSHKHGTNTYASRTEAGAQAKLAAFCRDYWEDRAAEEAPEDPPTDDAEVVDLYFDGHYDEFYSIDSCELDDDPTLRTTRGTGIPCLTLPSSPSRKVLTAPARAVHAAPGPNPAL